MHKPHGSTQCHRSGAAAAGAHLEGMHLTSYSGPHASFLLRRGAPHAGHLYSVAMAESARGLHLRRDGLHLLLGKVDVVPELEARQWRRNPGYWILGARHSAPDTICSSTHHVPLSQNLQLIKSTLPLQMHA